MELTDTECKKFQPLDKQYSLPVSEIPEFLRKVRAYPCDAQNQHAIMLLMMTGMRVSELLQARWKDSDLDGRKVGYPRSMSEKSFTTSSSFN